MAMAIIKVRDLCFKYNDETLALNKVSFNIEKGSYTTIIGHNGSGKSTLARLIVGLLEKESGSIKIDDCDLNEENICQIRSLLGIVFQNPDNQFIGSTVADDIAFGLENTNVAHEKMEGIINEYASKVGMLEFLEKEPQNLSGGQKQRVAIAAVLAMNPDIIIFDEATSMLDPKAKSDIKKLIHDVHKQGKTIISITHDIEEALESDEVIVLNRGTVYKSGKPCEVFKNAKELIDIDLDIPFSIQVKEALNKEGIKLTETANLEILVEELCQLKSKI